MRTPARIQRPYSSLSSSRSHSRGAIERAGNRSRSVQNTDGSAIAEASGPIHEKLTMVSEFTWVWYAWKLSPGLPGRARRHAVCQLTWRH